MSANRQALPKSRPSGYGPKALGEQFRRSSDQSRPRRVHMGQSQYDNANRECSAGTLANRTERSVRSHRSKFVPPASRSIARIAFVTAPRAGRDCRCRLVLICDMRPNGLGVLPREIGSPAFSQARSHDGLAGSAFLAVGQGNIASAGCRVS